MKPFVISRQSFGCAVARGLSIVFLITALRSVSQIMAYVYNYTRNADMGTLTIDIFLPELSVIISCGLLGIWLWGRSTYFLPPDDDELQVENVVDISPGLVTQGVLLALAIFLLVTSSSHLIEEYLRVGSALKWRSNWNHASDTVLAVFLMLGAYMAGRSAKYSIDRAVVTSTSTDQRQQQPEPPLAQSR